MNNYYIYIYLDPIKSGQYTYKEYKFDYEPFYVGKGKDSRWKNIRGRKKDFIKIINEIEENGLEPIVLKLYENLFEEESLDKETELINIFGRLDLGTGILINKTSGGQGTSGNIVSEEIKKKLRKNFQDIKQEFERRNYILLTEEKDYKNNYTKLKYICPNGHEGSIRWHDFQQEQGCPHCAKNKIDFQDIKKEFERRKYIILSKEKDYKNSKKTKLIYTCPEGHEGSICWSDFQQGHGCQICWNESHSEKMRGKNSKLTEEQVIQIKLLLLEGNLTQQEIADIFGISQITISDIKRGKTWSWIKYE